MRTDTTILDDASSRGGSAILFKRRLFAVQVDVVVMGALCLALFLSAGPLASNVHWFWKPTAIVLALLYAVEMLTGLSPGKLAAGVRLRRPDGSRPSILSLVLRTFVRQAPITIFAASIYWRRHPANSTIFFVAFLLACCYVSVCYIILMRRGLTLFDMVGGTVLVSAGTTQK